MSTMLCILETVRAFALDIVLTYLINKDSQ